MAKMYFPNGIHYIFRGIYQCTIKLPVCKGHNIPTYIKINLLQHIIILCSLISTCHCACNI